MKRNTGTSSESSEDDSMRTNCGELQDMSDLDE